MSVREKNPDAVALGRLGGLKGGPARLKKLTPQRRREIAVKAVKTRWNSQQVFCEECGYWSTGKPGDRCPKCMIGVLQISSLNDKKEAPGISPEPLS